MDKKLKTFLSFLQANKKKSDWVFEAPLYFQIEEDLLQHSLLDPSKPGPSSLLRDSSQLLPSLFSLSQDPSTVSSLPKEDLSSLALSLGESGSSERFRPKILPPALESCQIFMARAGGMGVVFFGYDTKKNHPVVIKTFRPDLFSRNSKILSRFIQEAHIWLSLKKHLFVIRAYDLEIVDSLPFLFLEFFPGVPAQDLAMGYSSQELVHLAYQVCRAISDIQEIHPHFVHGDIKPGNILYNQETGRAKLTDMGLSHFLQQDKFSSKVEGTPLYMAPEMWGEGEPSSESADVYSLGATLYELVVGHPPFLAENMDELYHKHATQEPHCGPAFDVHRPEMVELIIQCLDKNPYQRPENFSELTKEMEKLLRFFDKGKYFLWKSRFTQWTYPFSLESLKATSKDKVSQVLSELFSDLSQKEKWTDQDFLTLVHLSRLQGAYKLAPKGFHNFEKISFPSEFFQKNSLEFLYVPRADFSHKNLSSQNLKGAFLEGVNFSGANLQEANLQGARLKNANFTGANLEGANLDETILGETNFQRACLRGASFQRASMGTVHFPQANLEGVKFCDTNLSLAWMVQANLKDCDFSGATIHPFQKGLFWPFSKGPIPLDGLPGDLQNLYCFSFKTWQYCLSLKFWLDHRADGESSKALFRILKKIKKWADPAFLQILPDLVDFPSTGILQKVVALLDANCMGTLERIILLSDNDAKDGGEFNEREVEILIDYLGKGSLALEKISRQTEREFSKKAQKYFRDLMIRIIKLCLDGDGKIFRDPQTVLPLMVRASQSSDEQVKNQVKEWIRKNQEILGEPFAQQFYSY